MEKIDAAVNEIINLVEEWELVLNTLNEEVFSGRRNSQNRTIKMIIGHLIDSASNNTHRIVHLQYQQPPLVFPNYATFGNNDRWIAIQNYENEDWLNMLQLWKYSNLHVAHVMKNVRPDKLKNEWIAGPSEKVSLESMIVDFPRHLKLHLSEIAELIGR